MRIKNRTDARRWVYHDLTAASLRKRSQGIRTLLDRDVTPAGVARVQAEMLRLASWLEAKAAKLVPAAGAADDEVQP